MSPARTSWGNVSKWYDELLENREGTYQKELILPNLLRLLSPRRDTRVLDLACGQGFFSRAFALAGAKVIGVDVSPELIALAGSYEKNRKKGEGVVYHVAPAHEMPFIPTSSQDAIVSILALQNMENLGLVFKECGRVLSEKGKLLIVLNHPAFRIPRATSWGWDPRHAIQYRRVDAYLSESKTAISMHPGANPKEKTFSFHRPLQFYAKALAKSGFAITRIEEWESHRRSEPGPRAEAEDLARKEMPLFLFLEVRPVDFSL